MMATENQQKVANLSTRNTIGEKNKKTKKKQKNKNNTTPEDIYQNWSAQNLVQLYMIAKSASNFSLLN